MPLSFDVHDEGCRPLSPCNMCKAAAFLRSKLTNSEVDQLRKILAVKVDRLSEDTSLNDPTLFVWSTRVGNALRNENIRTIGDLVRWSESELLRIPNLGRRSTREMREQLLKVGWNLGDLPKPEARSAD